MSETEWTAVDAKILEDVDKVGWSVMYVADQPPFAYTIAMHGKWNSPEVIVFGLGYGISVAVCNLYGGTVKSGGGFRVGVRTQDFFFDRDSILVFVEERHLHQYFGMDLFFYRQRAFPALQLIYSDANRVFPWEDGFTMGISEQPILSDTIPSVR